jgi:hypothetical protein
VSKEDETMVICGVELTGHDAVFALIAVEGNVWRLVDSSIRKLTLTDPSNLNDVRSFRNAINALLQEHQVSKIAIKSRNESGKFAGGAVTFKMEGILQLTGIGDIELLSPQTIASELRRSPVSLPDGLYRYQEEAFKTAYVASRRVVT